MKTPPIPPCWTGLRVVGAFLCYLTLQTSGFAQAPSWGTPLTQPGIAAATCAGPSKDLVGATIPPSAAYTFGLVDLRSPSLPDYGGCVSGAPLWNAPMFHHSSWNAKELGNVFGITLDARGNIYLAAHGLYGAYRPLHHRYGDIGGGAADLSAAGTIYKVDRLTSAVSVFAVVPGQQAMALSGGLVSGPGLGNVSYDAVNNQFFTTSLEDGKIYRINAGGTIVQTFDPLTADNGAVGLPPLRERLWGIEVERGAVYYSVWNAGTTTNPGKVRRVNILPSGALNPGSDTEVLTIPGKTYAYHSVPIADLTFSNDGRTMVLGERSMLNPTYSYNHRSNTHIAELTGSTWAVTKTMATGCNVPQGEAYGGVAYGNFAGNPEGTIWSTSADMRSGYGPHGLFGVRTADFPTSGKAANSWKVPYDPGYTDHYLNDLKGSGGDVEIVHDNRCANLQIGRIECPDEPRAPYETTLSITNLSTNKALYAVLTPCPVGQLPSSATTGQPSPAGVITLPSPIGTGDTTTINIAIPWDAGDVFCFQVTLLTRDGEECCTEKICVRLPDCGCAQLVDHKIECEVQADGTIKYTIVMDVKNLTAAGGSPYPFGYATILPPAGFSPSLLSPSSGPIAPGATGTFKTCYYGAPGKRCFDLALHDPNFTTCCSIEVCLDLPRCGEPTKPDTCAVRSRLACCPPDGVTPVPFTICNNSTVPRTYTWTASGVASAACTQTLTAAHFSPSSGTLGPVAPGGCLTGVLRIRCANFAPGDCARFKICFSHNPLVPPTCCISTVYRPGLDEPVVKIADTPVVVPIGGVVPVKISLSNPGTTVLRVPVLFFSEDGALDLGDGEPGPGGADIAGIATRVVSLSPGESQDLTIDVRLPEDSGSDHAPLAIFVGAESLEDLADAGSPIIVPIRSGRLREVVINVAALRVDDIDVVHGEQAEVVMAVPTVSGHRYRVEQSESMQPGWKVSICSVQDVVTGPDGVFIGTGGTVTCKVPCGVNEGDMFFRIRDLSLD